MPSTDKISVWYWLSNVRVSFLGSAQQSVTESSQSNAPRSLCILWHCREFPRTAPGASGRGALLAQNVEQSELERRDQLGAIPADQGTVPAATTKAVSPLPGAASYRHAVKQLLKSVVREICTLRSVGAGGGRPPPATRWATSDGRPYRDSIDGLSSREPLFSSSDIPRVPYTGRSGHIRKHLPTSPHRSECPSQSGLFPDRITCQQLARCCRLRVSW